MKCFVDGRAQRFEPGRDVGPQVDAERPPVSLGEDLEVAAGLGRLDDTERVPLSRDRHVLARRRR